MVRRGRRPRSISRPLAESDSPGPRFIRSFFSRASPGPSASLIYKRRSLSVCLSVCLYVCLYVVTYRRPNYRAIWAELFHVSQVRANLKHGGGLVSKNFDCNVRFWTFLVFGGFPILEWPFRVEGGTLEKNVQYEK